MNILFVTPYVPQPLRPRSRAWLKGLVERGHSVTLAVVSSDSDAPESLNRLRSLDISLVHARVGGFRRLVNYLAAILHGEPLQARHAWSPPLARTLKRILAGSDYDILHVEHLRGARYALTLRGDAERRGTRVVWDAVDCISSLLEGMSSSNPQLRWRLAARMELRRTRQFESRARHRLDLVLVASEDDRKTLVELNGASKPGGSAHDRVRVVPNGVRVTPKGDLTPAGERPPLIVFSGVMSYHANTAAGTWLLSEIMPRVWRLDPTVRVVLAGAHPPHSLRKLARANEDRVLLTGAVERLEPYLQQASVAVAPMLYGAGTQLKVLEAWASGTPIVTDERTAHALGVADGEGLLIARTADEFASALLRLLGDSGLRDRLGSTGYGIARNSFSWAQGCERLIAAYRELLD